MTELKMSLPLFRKMPTISSTDMPVSATRLGAFSDVAYIIDFLQCCPGGTSTWGMYFLSKHFFYLEDAIFYSFTKNNDELPLFFQSGSWHVLPTYMKTNILQW